MTWEGTYGDTRDLFVSNADGSDEQRLTSTSTLDETNPAWWPDGWTLAFDGGPGDDAFFAQDRWVDWIDGGPAQDTATCDFYDRRRDVEQYC